MNVRFLAQVGRRGKEPGCFSMISGVCAASSGEILVADNDRIHVFSAKGDFQEELPGNFRMWLN